MFLISALVDVAMAGLMVALLVYCVKLNRRLAAVRDSDTEIRQMIVELQTAADRAEASVGALKTAGVEAERLLRVQVVRAEALRDELGAIGRRPGALPPHDRAGELVPAPRRAPVAPRTEPRAPAATPQAARPAMPRPATRNEDPYPDGVPYPDEPASLPARRAEAEEDLLRAIRVARAGA
ncbi:MAG: hypothetical protein GEU92_18925 [Alphaproteobacteria bacterium]|nr:hypothetical protein [Alphaproteobacteria bacterium]